MDVLTDWLREIVTDSVVLSRSSMPGPWGMKLTAQHGVMFHIVTEGGCWLRHPVGSPIHLLQGDLVMVPRGLDHELVHDPAGESEPLEQFLARPSFVATGQNLTTLVCGVYRTDAQLVHPVLSSMPPVVHFSASTVRTKPALASILSLLTAELDRTAPGGEALVQHLFDALFVYAIRAWAEEAVADGPGWLLALKDPQLSKALAKIHAEPASPWTVESLSRTAGLSRAAFSRRFSQQIGEPPLTYLTRWRMGIAARLLRRTEAPLTEVAAQCGYESEFAFSRAFKRTLGLAPQNFRRRREWSPQPS